MNIHVPAFSRRRFLRALGQGSLLAALPAPLWAAGVDTVTISILHTTDLHGHVLPTTDYNGHPDLGGLARCATQIRRWQKENSNNILIDIGDVYQGTELGLLTRGSTMIRGLNALAYDAWVVGNHEFDWGMEAFAGCVALSSMPVLSGNAMVAGQKVGQLSESTGPLAKLRPYIIKEVAGIRIAIVSLTTPALSTWIPPENLRGFEALDPVENLRTMMREVSAHKPDAIILAGHMGLTRLDNYANRVGALTHEFPQLTVYIGGHTHQNHPGESVNQVLYTQADHFGIYAGKVDLTFDRTTRRLRHREAITVLMDHQVALDPLVLSVAHSDLENAGKVLTTPMGELMEPFAVTTSFGEPSDVERLIGSAMIAALEKKGVSVDVVVHGLFDTKNAVTAGKKTVADAWAILPYENEIVTIDLAHDDLLALARDFGAGQETRNLMGIRVLSARNGNSLEITQLQAANGAPLPSKPTYRVAMNSYDSQSAGQRFPVVARLVASVSSHRVMHAIQTRDALIDFFASRQKISKASLLV